MLITVVFTLIDLNSNFIQSAEGATIYVGGTGAGNYSTIQQGVDAANSGDAVFVYNDGSPYVESVNLNYPIYLIADIPAPTIEGSVYVHAPNCLVQGFIFQNGGVVVYDDDCTVESNTIFGGTAGIGVHLESSTGHLVEYNYISSTDVGIRSWSADNSRIKGNQIHTSAYSGIELEADGVIVENNEIYDSNFFGGIYTYMGPNNITISNNTLDDSDILISDSSNIGIINNNLYRSSLGVSACFYGIEIIGNDFSSDGTDTAVWSDTGSQFNMVGCTISNYQCGFGGTEITAILTDCIIEKNSKGIETYSSDLKITNCSILSSSSLDLNLYSDPYPRGTYCTLVNTFFNKTKVDISGPNSTLEVQWYMHVNVTDIFGNPVQNANVWVEDNLNGTFNWAGITGLDGYVRWIKVTEYVRNYTTIINYTPHKVVAWNDTHAGFANAEMDRCKTVNITLEEGMIKYVSHGFSYLSIPVTISENEIETVLQSIEFQYDSVQWYDASDVNDPWKHYHITKPQHFKDLHQLDHTMGIWIHLSDPFGTVMVFNGSRPSSTQYIPLYSGWNMVGYPSLTNYNRTEALNNLTFDTHIDAIWTYNAAIQKWGKLGEFDYFEVGRGYYIHAISDCVWEVPL
jgi:parallel beta-helix repeat protein